MSSSDPSISVVVPCYNGAALLAETLQTALGQTHPPLEILVVDDGSTDDSAAIAESFGPPVRVVRQANRGESYARNRGIDEAQGNWIAFLDADDIWRPTKLQRQLEALDSDVTCVHTNFFYFGTSEGQSDLARIPPRTRYCVDYVAVWNPFRISSLMVHRGLPVRFPQWTQYGEDLIYFLDLALQAEFRLVEEHLTGYRVHRGGQSANPATALLRYQAIEEWMARQKKHLDDQTVGRIRDGWIHLIVEMATQAKYRRDWDQYWTIRRYLKSRLDHASVQPLLNERIFPRWAYTLKDAWDRLRDKIVRRRVQ